MAYQYIVKSFLDKINNSIVLSILSNRSFREGTVSYFSQTLLKLIHSNSMTNKKGWKPTAKRYLFTIVILCYKL